MMFQITESGARSKVLERLHAKRDAHQGPAREAIQALVDVVERDIPADATQVSLNIHLMCNWHREEQQGPREVGL